MEELEFLDLPGALMIHHSDSNRVEIYGFGIVDTSIGLIGYSMIKFQFTSQSPQKLRDRQMSRNLHVNYSRSVAHLNVSGSLKFDTLNEINLFYCSFRVSVY